MIELIFSLLLLSGQRISDDSWKQIIPLRSTRFDVERLLGAPSDPCTSICTYEKTKHVVTVRYTGEPCGNDDGNRWRVPMNTVFAVSVNLGHRPKISQLKLKLRDFTKTEDPELHGHVYYSNDRTGITYSVSGDGRVYRIQRFPSNKDDINLECL